MLLKVLITIQIYIILSMPKIFTRTLNLKELNKNIETKVQTKFSEIPYLPYEGFIIPSYQRPYEWGKNEIETLLSDIYYRTKNNSEYWLGFVYVTVLKDKKNNDKPYFEIIDGQQRLTTLFIICCVLHDVYPIQIEDFIFIEKFLEKDFQYYSFDKNVLEETNEESEVESGINNTSFFEKFLMKIKSLNLHDKRFKDNYKIINNWFIEKTKNDDNFIHDFISRLEKNISINMLEFSDVEKNILFSNINSKGKKLTLPDMIRNYFVHRDKEQNFDEQIIDFFNSCELNRVVPKDMIAYFKTYIKQVLKKDISKNDKLSFESFCNWTENISDDKLFGMISSEKFNFLQFLGNHNYSSDVFLNLDPILQVSLFFSILLNKRKIIYHIMQYAINGKHLEKKDISNIFVALLNAFIQVYKLSTQEIERVNEKKIEEILNGIYDKEKDVNEFIDYSCNEILPNLIFTKNTKNFPIARKFKNLIYIVLAIDKMFMPEGINKKWHYDIGKIYDLGSGRKLEIDHIVPEGTNNINTEYMKIRNLRLVPKIINVSITKDPNKHSWGETQGKFQQYQTNFKNFFKNLC